MLTKKLAIQLIESDKLFPVDFNEAWQWIEYSTKGNAKVALKKEFTEGIDFEVIKSQKLRPQGGYSNLEEINLTIDCFKSFAMMAGTTKGKQVRQYFIECERELRKQQQLTPEEQAFQLAKALIASHEKNQKQAKQIEQQQAQIEANKPKVEFAEAIQHSDTAIDIGSYAKNIGTGRNRLFRIMRDLNIIIQSPSTLPYQRYIDAGYFEVSQEIKQTGRNSSKLIPFALITPKGQLWLYGKVKKAIAMESTMAISIVQGALNLQ